MFKEINGYRMPQGQAEAITIFPASLGGGFIANISINGKIETMCFANHQQLSQIMMLMLTGPQMMANAIPPAGAASPVPAAEVKRLTPEETAAVAASAQAAVKKSKGGRPKLTEEEKAANKARREQMKANGAGHGTENVPTGAKVEEVAQAA